MPPQDDQERHHLKRLVARIRGSKYRESGYKQALDAVKDLRELGWLRDGSLRGADLMGAALSAANLRSADLRASNLRDADLSAAALRGTDLSAANLVGSYLRGADLRAAYLRDAVLSAAALRAADLRGADLSGTVMSGVYLRGADLRSADLRRADLRGVDLRDAALRAADLRGAILSGADLRFANLRAADLSGAVLSGANFIRANLIETNFADALCSQTTFAEVDLSVAVGLETVQHGGPSHISISTLYKSKGNISPEFLLGCGVPLELVEQIPRLFAEKIFYSCFISYSRKDAEFAQRLNWRLQETGVNTFLDIENLKNKGGQNWQEEIRRAVQNTDRLLICCSANALESENVRFEIKVKMDQEKEEREKQNAVPFIIIPIDLDGYVIANAGKDLIAFSLTERRQVVHAAHWNEDATLFEAVVQQVINALRT